MAYTIDDQAKEVVTWDSNPYGESSTATIVDNAVTELVVANQQGVNVIYSIDMTMLSHLKTVITDLETILATP